MPEKENLIQSKSFLFALEIIKLFKFLHTHKEFVISRQVLKSGTSIGANVEEAIAAESKKDFIHKMTIACKEARETRFWLRLLDQSQIVKNDYLSYLTEVNSIISILTKIIKTSSQKP